ncbi:MAG: hypothetical protein HY959_10860 [Ignavibacteriae bacterium]|nr:hypothetical protein [Ignavibacteriota bacterium]
MRNKFFIFFFLIFLFSFFYSQVCISQEHPLVNKKFGNIIFMKNATTDIQSDYSNDTCYFLETTKSVIPEIWVRAFLKNNLQHFIDDMKKKHEKITYLNLLFGYTVTPYYYLNGKERQDCSGSQFAHNGEEKINIDKLTDYSVNTVAFKFSDFEHFIKAFEFRSKNLQSGQILVFKISCTLKFQCVYVNVLEKTKTEFYKDDKGFDILARMSDDFNESNYPFFKVVVK